MLSKFIEFCKSSGEDPSEWAYIEKGQFNCMLQNICDKDYIVTSFVRNGQKYRFFENGDTCFMTFTPTVISNNILQLHLKIIQTIGVVMSVYSTNSIPFFENFSYIFNCSEDTETILLIQEDCKLENTSKDVGSSFSCANCFPVAYEANGNAVLYDPTGNVVLYAQDFTRDDIVLVKNLQSKCLYKFKNIENFQDYAALFFSSY